MNISKYEIEVGASYSKFEHGRSIKLIAIDRPIKKENYWEVDFWDKDGNIITIKSNQSGYFDLMRIT